MSFVGISFNKVSFIHHTSFIKLDLKSDAATLDSHIPSYVHSNELFIG